MKIVNLVTESATTKNWSRDLESSSIDYYDLGLNSYDFCFMEKGPFASVFISVIYFMIFFTGFFGNLFVVLVMMQKEVNQRLVDNFILNLAIADLVFVCTLPFWALSEAFGSWHFGEELCKFSSYVIHVNRCSSILFLTGMSVERFLVMNKHWDSRSIGTKRNISMTCSCIWVFSLLLGIPSLVYRKLIPVGGKFSCQEEEISPIYNLAILFLTFLLPLVVILFCYCSIFSKLRSHVILGKRRNHAFKIIFVVIGAFICFWLPLNTFKAFNTYSTMRSINLSCEQLKALTRGLTISACLAFTNSCTNPIIYVFMDQQFRHKVVKSFPTFCSQRENVQSSAPSFSSTESSLLFANRKKSMQRMSVPLSRGQNYMPPRERE